MWVDPQHPTNAGVLRFLCRGRQAADFIDPDDQVGDAYYGCGSHPEIVERVWDQLGRGLPTDCRCVLCGTPALVQSRTGIVLAVAMGTQYCLRLPDEVAVAEALAAGAQVAVEWADLSRFNVQ